MDDQAILSAKELSGYLGVPYKTLLSWRVEGFGPQAMKLGRHLRYRKSDVDQWLAQQREDTVGGPALARKQALADQAKADVTGGLA